MGSRTNTTRKEIGVLWGILQKLENTMKTGKIEFNDPNFKPNAGTTELENLRRQLDIAIDALKQIHQRCKLILDVDEIVETIAVETLRELENLDRTRDLDFGITLRTEKYIPDPLESTT